jgi:CTP-dependent riboflavin kinase
MTSSVNSYPPAETLEQLMHRKLCAAVELEVDHPKRDERIYGAVQIYMALTGDIDGGMDMYNQFATVQL